MPEDTIAPTLIVSLSPNVINANNHKLVAVSAEITVADVCDGTPTLTLVSVVSSEPDEGISDGDTPDDVQGDARNTDDREFFVRAERGGNGDGRVYAVTYRATDASGNYTETSATVTIPHDQADK